MLDADYIRAILNGNNNNSVAGVFSPEKITRPAMIDLFCGAGGCTKGYQKAGFATVVGVDIKPQPRYCGNQFVQSDALKWVRDNLDLIRENFDAIHASPPCQGYSISVPQHHRANHPQTIIEQTRELLIEVGLPYIIENVAEGYHTGLVNPIKLCGSSFSLRIRRHRLFETSFPVEPVPCDHKWQDDDPMFLIKTNKGWRWTGIITVWGNGGGKGAEYWPWAMGCGEHWDNCWMNRYELSQAIPPAYTEYIGKELLSIFSLTTSEPNHQPIDILHRNELSANGATIPHTDVITSK